MEVTGVFDLALFNGQVDEGSWIQAEFFVRRKKRNWVVVDEGSGVIQEYFLKMRVVCLHDDGRESSRQGACSGTEERGNR